MIIQKGGPRRNTSLVGQRWDHRVQSTIKINVSDHSMDKDKYRERPRQGKAATITLNALQLTL